EQQGRRGRESRIHQMGSEAAALSPPAPARVNGLQNGRFAAARSAYASGRRTDQAGAGPRPPFLLRESEAFRAPRGRRRLAQAGPGAGVVRIVPPRPDIAAGNAADELENLAAADHLAEDDTGEHADADRREPFRRQAVVSRR